MLLDQVDEERGVHHDGTGPEDVAQSHARRSASTCAEASVCAQTSFPSPCSPRIESGSARSRASSRICVTSWVTDRCCRFARALSRLYNASGSFFMFNVAMAIPPYWRKMEESH